MVGEGSTQLAVEGSRRCRRTRSELVLERRERMRGFEVFEGLGVWRSHSCGSEFKRRLSLPELHLERR